MSLVVVEGQFDKHDKNLKTLILASPKRPRHAQVSYDLICDRWIAPKNLTFIHYLNIIVNVVLVNNECQNLTR
jgi:hypothetical protein